MGYLEELIKEQYVEKMMKNDHEYFFLTDKGFNFMQQLKQAASTGD